MTGQIAGDGGDRGRAQTRRCCTKRAIKIGDRQFSFHLLLV